MRWQIYDEGLLLESETFTLEAMCHVIGMVSSGKSTLMDVLAVHMAKQKKRVTVVLNDVVSVLERVELYGRYGVGAAPMLGKSDREGHINRLHRTQRNLSLASRDPRARWVSPFCPLDALVNTARPLELKDAPCQTLTKVGKEPKKHPKRYCCPFWRACPRFEADRHLVNANIWVATPASLVYAGVPKGQNRESLRYLELALRQSDLVIVDEADRVQRGLDQIFAPNQVIFDREGRSLLGGLQAKVNPMLDQKGRSQLKNREVESWVMLHDVAQIASKRLYALVYQNTHDVGRREGDLKRYLGALPFNGVTLSQRLVETWFGEEDDADGLLSHFEKVINDPLGEQESGELTGISRELLTYSSFTATRSKLEDFLKTHTKLQEAQREKAAIKLELFLLTCILTNRLEKLLSQWPHIEGVLAVDNELSGRPPRDYMALVPTSPMGNILALQFTQVDEGLGDLRYLRCAGVGRYLLLNLHELFVGDEFANPHVLLLSETSWAGTSPNYHVQVPVTGVLRAPDEEVTAIAKSRFEFTSLGGSPVRVSGSRGGVREDALAKLIHRLMRKSDISGRSLLDAHLNELPESRQRALVLTGSYEETEHVFREICRVRPDWQNEVRFLQADKDGDKGEKQVLWYGQDGGLRRGVVDTFATTGAKVLVAPLLAVGRGRNILNSEGYAAIGAAYLLVRPHPRPNELDYALHSIDRWAVDELQKPVEGSLEQAAKDKRRRAFQRWIGLLKTQLRYADLADKKPDQVGEFIKNLLDVECSDSVTTLLLMRAQNIRHVWTWVQDGNVRRNIVSFGTSEAFPMSRWPGLRIARIRDDERDETPEWYAENEETYGLASGVFKMADELFASVTGKPKTQTGLAKGMSRFPYEEDGELQRGNTKKAAWNPGLKEVFLAGLQSGDDGDVWAHLVDRLRGSSSYTVDPLALPYPLHLVKQVGEYTRLSTVEEDSSER